MKSYNKYNVLIYGSGGRENALAYKVAQSPLLNKLFLALPNDGFKCLGEEIIFSDFENLAKKCLEKEIDLVVIGPEEPLANGIVDTLNNYGIKCIGVNKKWAQLESSKTFAKEFMVKHDIPTAKYVTVKSKYEINLALVHFKRPPVLKADGLAAGKGVHISSNLFDAKKTLEEFLEGKWGEASSSVVVEEKLEGEELSIISIFDGQTLLPFLSARDYKRLHDGQKGPNTGGMGAYCPVKLTDEQENDLKEYLTKLENALKEENADFTGIIYSGLMLTPAGIKVLEYNMRFGDPETQPLMCHLESDILEIFIMASERKLSDAKLKWKTGTTVCVVVASDGYPEKPKKGCEIKGICEASTKYGTQIFYAGVKSVNIEQEIEHKKELSAVSSLVSNGGRVFNVCANGTNIDETRQKIYKTIEEIDFSDKIYRNDIGKVKVNNNNFV